MARDIEEYHAWEKNRGSYWENLKKSVNPVVIVGFLALLVLGAYMITQSKINPWYIYLSIAGIVVIIIWRATKQKDNVPIPENVIKIIGLSLMKRKIGIEYPNGTIISPSGYCRMRFEGEWGQPFRPWKWEVGFNLVYPSGLKETILVLFHPFEGYITGIVGKAAGYKGEESNDLKVLMPLSLSVQEEKPKK